jgi:hypothetical protein
MMTAGNRAQQTFTEAEEAGCYNSKASSAVIRPADNTGASPRSEEEDGVWVRTVMAFIIPGSDAQP